MGWQLAAFTEIVTRSNQSTAEVVLPNAIHHYAGSERIVLAGNGLGELKAAGTNLEGLAVRPGENFQELSRNNLAPLISPLNLDGFIARISLIQEHHGARWRAGVIDLHAYQLGDEPFAFLSLQATISTLDGIEV